MIDSVVLDHDIPWTKWSGNTPGVTLQDIYFGDFCNKRLCDKSSNLWCKCWCPTTENQSAGARKSHSRFSSSVASCNIAPSRKVQKSTDRILLEYLLRLFSWSPFRKPESASASFLLSVHCPFFNFLLITSRIAERAPVCHTVLLPGCHSLKI